MNYWIYEFTCMKIIDRFCLPVGGVLTRFWSVLHRLSDPLSSWRSLQLTLSRVVARIGAVAKSGKEITSV